jgi:small subunit ribosomal protein S13
MARIAGIDLPKNKRGEIGLTYIFGIGRSTAQYILDKAGIDFDKKVNQWNDDEQAAIRNIINAEFKVEGALRSEVSMSIKRLLDIACYRGLRHRKGLPVRGQRTKTNSRTRKGKRKTVAGKKKAAKKATGKAAKKAE